MGRATARYGVVGDLARPGPQIVRVVGITAQAPR